MFVLFFVLAGTAGRSVRLQQGSGECLGDGLRLRDRHDCFGLHRRRGGDPGEGGRVEVPWFLSKDLI